METVPVDRLTIAADYREWDVVASSEAVQECIRLCVRVSRWVSR